MAGQPLELMENKNLDDELAAIEAIRLRNQSLL